METLLPPFESAFGISILLGAFLAFFAFIGFEDMVNVAEEVKNPQQTLPTAILLALLIATLIYAAVSLVAVLTLDQSTLSASKAPLVDVLAASSDMDPRIISAIGLFAVINGALIQIIMASRIFYGMAKKGWLWQKLANINNITQTPVTATVLVIAIVLTLALWIPLETLAKMTSFLVLTVFALVNAALVIIKFKQTSPSGVINIPLWVPVTGALTSTSLVLFQLLHGL
jgi:amino acid transporter